MRSGVAACPVNHFDLLGQRAWIAERTWLSDEDSGLQDVKQWRRIHDLASSATQDLNAARRNFPFRTSQKASSSCRAAVAACREQEQRARLFVSAGAMADADHRADFGRSLGQLAAAGTSRKKVPGTY